MAEKIKRKIKRVEMGVVKLLLQWRDEINASGKACTLRPKKGEEPCISCGHYKKCHHYRWEREYVHKSDMLNREKIRERKQEKVRAETEVETEAEVLQEEETVYPCEPFDYGCPYKDICQGGRECPWDDED